MLDSCIKVIKLSINVAFIWAKVIEVWGNVVVTTKRNRIFVLRLRLLRGQLGGD